MNDLDRFHLAGDVVDRVPRLQRLGAHFKQFLRNKLIEHKQYMARYGDGGLPKQPAALWSRR